MRFLTINLRMWLSSFRTYREHAATIQRRVDEIWLKRVTAARIG